MTRLSLASLLALLAVGACKDASSPSGRTGSLTVHAYVDTDASGTMTAADTPLGSFGVALFRDGAQVAATTTDATGTATFDGLQPGSYSVHATGTTPAGAVLTTNPTPTAAVSFQGSGSTVDFRFAFFPGVVSGRIFREDNGTAGYQSGADTPGAGLKVYLLASTGGAPGAKIDSTTTDNEGAYAFPLVAPGSYFVSFENPGTIDYGTANTPQAVTVAGQQTASVNANFTGSLILTIAQARTKAVGSPIAIVGNIVVPPGVFTSGTGGVNSEIWVQDVSGGIAVFSVPTSRTDLPLGQKVQVTGTRGVNAGQIQITTPTVTPQTGTTIVGATPSTVAAAIALLNEGKLISVSGLKFVSATTPSAAGAFTVTLANAADATQTIQVRVNGASTGLTPANFVAGATYTVTGVLTQFNGTPQIKPRSPADVSGVTPGKIVINEIMPNPNKVADNFGEYIELFNAGGSAVTMTGWTINDGPTTAPVVITPTITIQPGGYALLAPNNDPLVNGGLPTVDFAYPAAIALSNTSDFVVLKDNNGTTIDSVRYATNLGAVAGVARGVINAGQDHSDVLGTNWVAQTTLYNGTDHGTPRAQNDGQVPPSIAPFARFGSLTPATVVSPAAFAAPRAARGPARATLPPTATR